MKSPVLLVTVSLTVAIVLTTALLIATGTRGDDQFEPRSALRGTEKPCARGGAAAAARSLAHGGPPCAPRDGFTPRG